MAVNSAFLEVRLEIARDLKDTETFGTQDPYVVLQVGASSARSKTHTDGGRCPVWRETLRFNNVIHEAELLLTVRNENVLSKDDVIGSARIPLAQVKASGVQTVHAPVVTPGGKQRGTITVVLTYRPAAATAQPAAAAAAPAPQAYSTPAPAPMAYPASAPYGAPPPQPAGQPYYGNSTYPAPGGAPAAAAYPGGQAAYGQPPAAYGAPSYSQAPAAAPAGGAYPPMHGSQPAAAGYPPVQNPPVQNGYPNDPYAGHHQQQQQQQQAVYGSYPVQMAGAYGQAPAPAPGAYYGAPPGASPYPAAQPYPGQAYPGTGYY